MREILKYDYLTNALVDELEDKIADALDADEITLSEAIILSGTISEVCFSSGCYEECTGFYTDEEEQKLNELYDAVDKAFDALTKPFQM